MVSTPRRRRTGGQHAVGSARGVAPSAADHCVGPADETSSAFDRLRAPAERPDPVFSHRVGHQVLRPLAPAHPWAARRHFIAGNPLAPDVSRSGPEAESLASCSGTSGNRECHQRQVLLSPDPDAVLAALRADRSLTTVPSRQEPRSVKEALDREQSRREDKSDGGVGEQLHRPEPPSQTAREFEHDERGRGYRDRDRDTCGQ